MKPKLLVGLGNPLAGDDGIGCHVVQNLARDPRTPQDTDVLLAGTDLLRFADMLESRRRLVIVDAAQDGMEPGTVTVYVNDWPREPGVREQAHHLSAVRALELLEAVLPTSGFPEVRLVTVSIRSTAVGTGLSTELAQKLPAMRTRVLEQLA